MISTSIRRPSHLRQGHISYPSALWRAASATCEGVLATPLLAKGLFDADEFGIGIAGGYATDLARELFGKADLVIGCGAGLGHYTTDAGRLYPNARVVQIDTNPRGMWQGLRVA